MNPIELQARIAAQEIILENLMFLMLGSQKPEAVDALLNSIINDSRYRMKISDNGSQDDLMQFQSATVQFLEVSFSRLKDRIAAKQKS